MSEFVDSHCHLDFEAFEQDRGYIISNANELGVNSFVIPAVNAQGWNDLIKLNGILTGSHIALGLHPYFIEQHKPTDLDLLDELLTSEQCVAVGECGLDTHCADIELQKSYFLKQIALANKYQKPLIVHHRRSHHLIFQCFKQITPKFGGVIHAFSGSEQDANKYINLGFMLGAGGVITYERANKTRNVFKHVNLKHIVLETDAPDMPLAGKQGQRNEPRNIVLIAEELAKLKQINLDEVARATTQNCRQLFGF